MYAAVFTALIAIAAGLQDARAVTSGSSDSLVVLREGSSRGCLNRLGRGGCTNDLACGRNQRCLACARCQGGPCGNELNPGFCIGTGPFDIPQCPFPPPCSVACPANKSCSSDTNCCSFQKCVICPACISGSTVKRIGKCVDLQELDFSKPVCPLPPLEECCAPPQPCEGLLLKPALAVDEDETVVNTNQP